MAGKHQKDEITDEDIDNLFNNDNNQKFVEKKEKQDIVPHELSTENTESVNHIDRPKEVPLTEKNRVKNEINRLKEEGVQKVRKFIKFVRDYKKVQELRNITNRQIVNGQTPTHLDPGTECTFHIYQPRDIMGNKMTCSCKFCSALKEFTQEEWDEYCIKYRKWF